MTSMRISELADRAGVPASTLRFYEKNGLLPAARAASGYRVYDDDAVARLAFIKAAKLLGLSLSEVSALVAVWLAASCDDVRAELRPRLADRIASAERRQAELAAFTAALHRVLRHLDTMPGRADRCDERCGYTDPGRWPTTAPAWPSPGPAARARGAARPGRDASGPRTTVPGPAEGAVPIACSLDSAQVARRLAEWRIVLDGAERADTPGGVRLTVPAARAGDLAALAAAEQACCPFFGFLIQFDGSVVHLDVSGPAGATDMLSALFG